MRTKSLILATIVLAGVVLYACAINPATGQRQFTLISESQEIAMGRENDRQIVQSLGLYPDEALQQYIQQLGEQLAGVSERPDLEWTFRVVDDPVVNAFALPGGYIYITRGIMAHLGSESELAAVVGHEIGHVTGRHGVSQMSKAQLAQIGLGVGYAVSENVRKLGSLLEPGLGLLFLKFSRDHERQADDLGLRYLLRTERDPRPMAHVYAMLASVSQAQGAGAIPPLLSTHPAPENREGRIDQQLSELNQSFEGLPTGRESFLAKIDGIVFGENPREGYFKDNTFMHPELEFSFRFPGGWKTQNARTSVGGQNEAGNAMIQLSLVEAASAREALDAFFSEEGLNRGASWDSRINGYTTGSNHFSATIDQGTLQGLVAFVEYREAVYRLIGYATQDAWTGERQLVEDSLSSFTRLRDSKALAVQPAHLKIVKPDRQMDLAQFAERYGASVDVNTLALINQMNPSDKLRAGRSYKIVTGGKLP